MNSRRFSYERRVVMRWAGSLGSKPGLPRQGQGNRSTPPGPDGARYVSPGYLLWPSRYGSCHGKAQKIRNGAPAFNPHLVVVHRVPGPFYFFRMPSGVPKHGDPYSHPKAIGSLVRGPQQASSCLKTADVLWESGLSSSPKLMITLKLQESKIYQPIFQY